MFSSVLSAAICGIDGRKITVEADVSDGLPVFSMVGYLASEVREAQDRVRTALKNTGIRLPARRITVNLAPADIRKAGSGFDLLLRWRFSPVWSRFPGREQKGFCLWEN